MATVAGIFAVVANIRKLRVCFAVWIVTNMVWMVLDAYAGLYAQSFLHVVYFGLSIWGWTHWTKTHGTERRVSTETDVSDGERRVFAGRAEISHNPSTMVFSGRTGTFILYTGSFRLVRCSSGLGHHSGHSGTESGGCR